LKDFLVRDVSRHPSRHLRRLAVLPSRRRTCDLKQ